MDAFQLYSRHTSLENQLKHEKRKYKASVHRAEITGKDHHDSKTRKDGQK